MRTRVECFMADPTELAEESLRRYVSSEKAKCPLPFGYHTVSVVLGHVPWHEKELEGTSRDDFPKSDPRWPKACDCGYVFQPLDEWQHSFLRLYNKRGTDQVFVLSEAPIGAMWHAPWYEVISKGPDGLSLVVRLPDNHDWFIDGPSRSGGRWTRTGTPPKITARPSILTPRYHGFLTDGVLESC